MGIFKSADAGSTWALLPATMTNDFSTVSKVIVTSLGHVYAATNTGIPLKGPGSELGKSISRPFWRHRSYHCGEHSLPVVSMAITTSQNQPRAISVRGPTCARHPVGLPSTGISRIETAVAPSDANQVYTAFYGHHSHWHRCYKKMAIYSSTNNGVSFSRVGRPKDIDGALLHTITPTPRDGMILF